MMETLRLTLRPRSAFGGPIHGDTLFGQICWAVRNRWGEGRLTELLDGYGQGRPFAVCSDAFPSGFLPRPALPLYRYETVPGADRKAVKRRRWLPLEALAQPVETWLREAVDEATAARRLTGERGMSLHLAIQRPQPHNSIDRRSGTTGPVDFAPYTLPQHWYAQGIQLDAYLVLEGSRIDRKDIEALIGDIGRTGFGRDASVGLGKFDLVDTSAMKWPTPPDANASFTLAPCAPQGLGLPARRAYYELFTRFGRHGDRAVFEPGGPFKTPILMAATGALFGQSESVSKPFIGQGLGGDGRMSKSIRQTVQQGYAPCVPARMNWEAA